MKKKILKVIALITALVLLAGVLFTANALNGNPISRLLAQRTAKHYLREVFADTDYYVDSVGFSFKDTCYYAHIRSDSSIDTRFTLYIDMLGRLYFDTYESVISGDITARRLEQEYRDLTAQVFESPAFPYGGYICYGTLEVHDRIHIREPGSFDIPSYSIATEDLVIDQVYDTRELGAQAGKLIVYVERDIVTAESAARILLDIRAFFDDANIPFRAVDFVLEYPLPEEGPRPDGDIRVENFPYEDIAGNNLAGRLAQADAALDAKYAAMDAEK